MKPLLLLIAASLRSQVRVVKSHLYSWLILTPMIIGITYLSVARLTEEVSMQRLSFLAVWIIGTLLCLSLIGFTLSRAVTELYHLRRPESYLDALPVAADTHFDFALLSRLSKTLLVGLAILVVEHLLHDPISFLTILSLIAFILLLTLTEIFAALFYVHWQRQSNPSFRVGAMVLVFALAAFAGAMIAAVFKPQVLGNWKPFCLAVIAFLSVMMAVRKLPQRWRAIDMEYARQLQSGSRLSLFRWQILRRRFSPSIAAQLARDLQLTLRGFSSAVYVVTVVALALLIALFALLKSNFFAPFAEPLGWFDAARLSQIYAVKITCALVTTTLAILTPILVAYQLPHLWLERTTETSGLDLWQTKLHYTRLISSPAPWLTFCVGVASGSLPKFYLPLLFVECLMIWWALSSLIGALAYEMPTRSGLAIILMATIGTAGGLASAFGLLTSALLPFGALVYSQAMHGLTEKGRTRARYLLLIGED
jgi:hypothetical protein